MKVSGAINGTLRTCGNVTCLQEGNKFKSCEKCESVYYHARECQKAHWNVHKSECRGLADKKLERMIESIDQKLANAKVFDLKWKNYIDLLANNHDLSLPIMEAFSKEKSEHNALVAQMQHDVKKIERFKHKLND